MFHRVTYSLTPSKILQMYRPKIANDALGPSVVDSYTILARMTVKKLPQVTTRHPSCSAMAR
jgi:hypothetical protein